MIPEKIVFSFCIFGSVRKYTEGVIVNAKMIAARFPTARTQVYVSDDVPADIVSQLAAMPTVRIVSVPRLRGRQNTLDRFLAIDDADCDVMFSRDADSRVNERDAVCVEEFLASSSLFHIIRDHKNHNLPIMAGMWGLRKAAITGSMRSTVESWKLRHDYSRYGGDQDFLRDIIYPIVSSCAMIHDPAHHFIGEKTVHPIRSPIVNNGFIGNVYDFAPDGKEITMF